ncbi:DUF3631 domain-containing protein [Sutterella sp.]|uniref:DUF3631 domain-containing protein n=1 Tax=Sutterella sp. TaxID=1981025 RepID=UPI003FD6F9A5
MTPDATNVKEKAPAVNATGAIEENAVIEILADVPLGAVAANDVKAPEVEPDQSDHTSSTGRKKRTPQKRGSGAKEKTKESSVDEHTKAIDFMASLFLKDFQNTINDAAKFLPEALGKFDQNKWKEGLRALRAAMLDGSQLMPWQIDPEPWPEVPSIRAVVEELIALVLRVVHCSDAAARTVAYFCLATWFLEYSEYAPYLTITAAQKRCGKSTLMDLMQGLCRRPLPVGAAPSAPFVFRSLEEYEPTAFFDEVDTYLARHDELQGILNSGITRNSAFVGRTVGKDSASLKPKTFKCFGMKVFSGIRADGAGAALMDRAIIVKLEPAPKGRKLTKLRDVPQKDLEVLRRKMARLAVEWGPKMKGLRPHERPRYPESFNSRECDKWEPLFTLAQFAGEADLQALTAAAVELKNDAPETEDRGYTLLCDIREIIQRAEKSDTGTGFDFVALDGTGLRFNVRETKHGDAVMVLRLCQVLMADKEKDWSPHGTSSLTPTALGRALQPYRVKSVSVRLTVEERSMPDLAGKTVMKFYPLESFRRAFATYLPPLEVDDEDDETGAA